MALDDTPTWAELILQGAKSVLAAFWTAVPYVVESFDAATQTALLNPIYEDLPKVKAPVIYPGGSAFQATWVLTEGDTGLLIVCTKSIAGWIDGGGTVAESKRRGNLSDGVFLPVSFSGATIANTTIGDLTATHIQISPTQATINSPLVLLGSATAAHGVAHGDTLATFLGLLKTWLDTHVHAGDGIPPTVSSPTVPTVTSTKVRAD